MQIPMRPLKAIRAKCLECQGGSLKAIRLCQSYECSLWEFRFGKNPHKKGCTDNLRPFQVINREIATEKFEKNGILEGASA